MENDNEINIKFPLEKLPRGPMVTCQSVKYYTETLTTERFLFVYLPPWPILILQNSVTLDNGRLHHNYRYLFIIEIRVSIN